MRHSGVYVGEGMFRELLLLIKTGVKLLTQIGVKRSTNYGALGILARCSAQGSRKKPAFTLSSRADTHGTLSQLNKDFPS